MFSFRIGHITVDVTLLIAILLAALLVACFRAVLLRRNSRALVASCQTGDYRRAIAIAGQLLKAYQRSARLFRTRGVRETIDRLRVLLAVSYLGLSDVGRFWSTIRHAGELPEKQFWIAVCACLQGDTETAREAKAGIPVGSLTQTSVRFLEGVLMAKEGNPTGAKELLRPILPELKFVLLRDIAREIVAESGDSGSVQQPCI